MSMKRTPQTALFACLLLTMLGCPNPAGNDPSPAPATAEPSPSPAGNAEPSLSAITLSDGLALSPAFNPDTLAYTVKVPNAITGITVAGIAGEGAASVSPAVNLSGLAVGVSQTATLTVTAADTTARSYTVAATRWPVVPAASENLLVNGGFDDGLFGWSPWSMPGATVDAQVVNGEMRIQGIPTSSHNPWDCTVSAGRENNLTLRRNKAYTLSFDAYSEPSGAYLAINFQERGRDLNGDGSLNSSYGSDGFHLMAPAKTHYSLSIVMGNPEDDAVELQFQAGMADAAVYLDNIVLRETGDGSLSLAGNWTIESYMSLPIEITNAKFLAPDVGMDADIIFYNDSNRTMVVRYLAHPGGAEYAGLYQKFSWTMGPPPVYMTLYGPSATIAAALASATVESVEQLMPPSNGVQVMGAIPGDGSVAIAWRDPTDPDVASLGVSWDGGSRSVPLGLQTLFIDGLANGQEYAIRIDSLDSEAAVVDTSYVAAFPSATATPGSLDVWLGPAEVQFGSSTTLEDQGYVQVGGSADISELTADLDVAFDLAAANQYLVVFFRNKYAKVDSIEYLDSGGNVVGYFSGGSNGEIGGIMNRSNTDWTDTEANLLAQDGNCLLLGCPDWYSSIGMRYGAGTDFTRMRIRLRAD